MPRDSTATKERLLREAERLFARRGLYQVTVREITEAAEQRNVSALNYHFGSREGLLDAILSRHGDPIDVARGERLDRVGREASTRELVEALVVPYAANLAAFGGPRLPAHRRAAVGAVQHLAGAGARHRARTSSRSWSCSRRGRRSSPRRCAASGWSR